MNIINYLNLNQHPIQLSFEKDRTYEFNEIYHSHQGIEFLYVHSGSGNVVTDGKIIELKKGVLFCFKPFHMHRVQIHTENSHYVRSLIIFEPSFMEQYLKPFLELNSFFNELLSISFTKTVFTELPQSKFEHFINEYTSRLTPAISEKLENEVLFLIAFINLLKHTISNEVQNLKGQQTYNANESIHLTLNWLETHYKEPFSLKDLANSIHLSPNYISYLFQKETGSSISDYLAVRRIQEACLLIKTTSLSIEQVGSEIGLINFSYFCKFFKKYVGMTPLKFRSTQLNKIH